MASLDHLSPAHRALLKVFPWRRAQPVAGVRLGKPLAQCRVALVSSAGLVAPGQAPFDDDMAGGDYSFRVIPGDVDVQRLSEHHRSSSFDHAGIAADRNLALPLDRLRELATGGEIGQVAPRHLSFMGSISAPGRLLKRSAPEAARLLVDDQVDVALLVPV
jgi:D-proline reductase (dithiol) PrdB